MPTKGRGRGYRKPISDKAEAGFKMRDHQRAIDDLSKLNYFKSGAKKSK